MMTKTLSVVSRPLLVGAIGIFAGLVGLSNATVGIDGDLYGSNLVAFESACEETSSKTNAGECSPLVSELRRSNDIERTFPIESQDNQLPAGYAIERDVAYARVGERILPLDIRFPVETRQGVPLVVWIHGGAWRSGSKNNIGPTAGLLERGYAVASVEYRLSGEAIFPAAIEDCKAAISFLRLHAETYNIDPERIGVWGSSAGGHLASLVGTTGNANEFESHDVCREASSQVQAVFNWFGPSDFLRMNDVPGAIDHDSPDSPESLFLGGPIQEIPDRVAQANPITYIDERDPPFLHLHGDQDRLVPFQQSELLHSALVDANVQSELVNVIDGDHGFRTGQRSRRELIEQSMVFFDQILKPDNAIIERRRDDAEAARIDRSE